MTFITPLVPSGFRLLLIVFCVLTLNKHIHFAHYPVNVTDPKAGATPFFRFLVVMKPWNDWKIVLMFCLTLGLAPFTPEPHLIGKLRWVLGGAVGMQPMDWFDLLMHGFPWLLLLRLLAIKGAESLRIQR